MTALYELRILLQELIEAPEAEGLLSHALQHLEIFKVLQPLQHLLIFLNIHDHCPWLAFPENDLRGSFFPLLFSFFHVQLGSR